MQLTITQLTPYHLRQILVKNYHKMQKYRIQKSAAQKYSMVSISAPQPICHKAMAAKIVIFTWAAIAIAAIKKSNSATAGLQCTITITITIIITNAGIKKVPLLICIHLSTSYLSNNHLTERRY